MRAAHSSGFMEASALHWEAPRQPDEDDEASPAPRAHKPGGIVAPRFQLFEVHCKTNPGDAVVIVGSSERLGKWDPRHGISMLTDDLHFPIWFCWVAGCLPPSEYKFVVLSGSNAIEWEQIENRVLAPLTTRVAAIYGEPKAITATASSDGGLFRLRQGGGGAHGPGGAAASGHHVPRCGQRSKARSSQQQVSPPLKQTVSGAPVLGAQRNPSFGSMPPSLGLGNPFQVSPPVVQSASAYSSTCPSANGSGRDSPVDGSGSAEANGNGVATLGNGVPTTADGHPIAPSSLPLAKPLSTTAPPTAFTPHAFSPPDRTPITSQRDPFISNEVPAGPNEPAEPTRSPSKSCLTASGSQSALRRNGSRVSFSQDLNKLG